LQWAAGFARNLGAEGREELERFGADAQAMEAVERAQRLRLEAAACAEEARLAEVQQRPASKAAERAEALAAERGRIVTEALGMIERWKKHSKVAHELVGALVSMAETGGDEFVGEMDRRGVAVVASMVADVWARRPQVARTALQLLAAISIELLIQHIEGAVDSDINIVHLGLEVLNRAIRMRGMAAIDEAATHGGREMLDTVEGAMGGNPMVSLHLLNLRRRLKKSIAKSLRPKKAARLPAEDVVRLKGCFDAMDEDESGYIDVTELSVALSLLGVKASRKELEDLMNEVDVDQSGRVEWPEFLWLMSRFGAGQSVEAQFSQERLAELREVFALFDADGNGSLDVKELGVVMRSLGLSPTEFELRAMVCEVDADGSECIEWPEFLHLMSRKVMDPEDQHKVAFGFFDKDNAGFIKREHFIAQMQALSDEFSAEDLDEMIYEAKFENGDLDALTYKEFVKMMMRG